MSDEQSVESLDGPGWVAHDLLDVRGGLFPLSVETHFIATVAKLLPGTTTVTTLARYYSLHAFVATVAQELGLDWQASVDLLRRCEIVVAGATILALEADDERPHGHDTIRPRMDADGYLDVAGLAARPGGYSDQRSGFLPAYIGSENDTGLVAGNTLSPGPRADRQVLHAAFEGLLDLARRDRVELGELAAVPHLSVNALDSSPDGPWLARVLCGVDLPEANANDQVRNDTARLLGRALALHPSSSPLSSFRRLVMYGPALADDPIASAIPVGAAWRGCLFRHLSVGAWRILWHWTVGQIHGATEPREIAENMAAALPDATLGSFLRALPATKDGLGHPLPAEDMLREQDLPAPEYALSVLALGAYRTDELTGRASDAFADLRPTVLSPPWMKTWLTERHEQHLSVVAEDLVDVLLDRAKRVAFRKMRIRRDGTIWLPTRVHDRNGLLYAVGSESPRNVGVRLEQYARILRSLGVLAQLDGKTVLSAEGATLLKVQV
ncbi:MAG: hypothetical protein JWR83_1610 [Aeromicrobium sp.]|nr:hypothetical protein [Aeromicrobium sp.]